MPWLALRGAIVMGFAAIALQGGALTWIALGGCVGALLPLAGWRPLQHSTVWGWFTATILGSLGFAAWAGVGASIGLGTLLAYLQVHRRITGRGRADDRVSLLLAALMLVASAGSTMGPAFLVVTTVWALCLPMALMPAGTQARGALAYAGLVAVLAGALFVLAPRPRHTDVGDGRIELTGFSAHVELGDLDELLQDPGVVFRAHIAAPEGVGAQIYWRGVALDAFDGRRWTSTLPPAASPEAPEAGPTAVRISVMRESSSDGTLFVPGVVERLIAQGSPTARDPHGAWFARESGRRVQYTVWVQPPLDGSEPVLAAERPGDPVLTRTTQLPGPLRSELEAWAAPIAGAGPPGEQIDRLAAYLRDNHRYTRNPRPASSEAPLRTFLFEGAEGHCEYFASALAVLARARGIPARVVNGFVSDAPSDDGWVTVRKHHAHSWVEVHDPETGWRIVDATPGPGAPSEAGGWARWWEDLQRWWLDGFLAYDGDRQRAVVERSVASPSGVGGWLLALAGLGGVMGWFVVAATTRWWPRAHGGPRTRSGGPVERLHAGVRRKLRARGVTFPPALPPVAAAQWYASRHPGDPAEALQALAWLVYETELAGRSPEEILPHARALARRASVPPPR